MSPNVLSDGDGYDNQEYCNDAANYTEKQAACHAITGYAYYLRSTALVAQMPTDIGNNYLLSFVIKI